MVWLLPSEMKGAGSGDRSNGDRMGRKMEWVHFTGRLQLSEGPGLGDGHRSQ